MSTALDPTRSASLLASAGTGKTWNLTARIARLLLAGAAPGGILALTFTRKAAAEMRQRVTARLQELAFATDEALPTLLRAIGAPDDADTQARARTLAESLAYAEVPLKAGTLHAFCQEVLGRFALEAQVPAGFTLVEDERPLRREAIARVLRQAHRERTHPTAVAFDTLVALGLSEYALHSLLDEAFEHRSELWAATEGADDPLAALGTALADALGYTPGEDAYTATEAPALLAKLKLFAKLLGELGPVGTVQAAALVEAVEATDAASRLQKLQATLFTDGERRKFKPAAKKYTPAQADTARSHFEALCEAVETATEAARRAATWQRTQAALTLSLAALGHFAEALRRSHQLGFAELEWHTVRLLSTSGSAEWVRYKLDARIEHLLLDEFQDTSPTQWRLLKPLLEEFAQHDADQRTAFLVGDAKQSIYGFRRAEPRLLGEASAWLQKHLGASEGQLVQSRRSAPAIIDFVNALFAGEPGEAIGFAAHDTARGGLYGQVEVAPLILRQPAAKPANDSGLRNPLTTPREEGEDARAAEEAQWVVDRLQQLLDARTPVTGRDGQSRALTPGDVLVLARHRTHLGALEKALAAQGIAYQSASRGTLLDSALARDLLALLAVLDGPHRNLDLAQALRSPLFSADDADLCWLADHAGDTHRWFDVLAEPGASPALTRAHGLLHHWQALSASLPPHDLIDRIACEGDVLRRYQAARPQDVQVSAQLSALLQLALDSDHGRYPTLTGFLRHCRELTDDGGPDEPPPAADSARLRLMTVHAAKGLEAPVVFLVNTAPAPRAAQAGWRVDWPVADERPRVVVHVGTKDAREQLSRDLIAAAQQREAREALNLLYVAVTRAEQYLFVSGFQSGPLQPESWHALCRRAVATLSGEVVESPLPLSYLVGAPPSVGDVPVEPTPALALDPRLRRPLSTVALAPKAITARNPDAALRGEAVHAALQWLAAGPLPPIALRARVQQQLGLSLDEALWSAIESEAQAVVRAPGLQAFFAQPLRAWNEVALHLDTPDGVQVNVLDRLVDTGEMLWVLDYKTHRSPSATAVLEGATEQLRRYIKAVQQVFPQRPVRAAVIWTPEARLLELPPQ